MRGSILPRRLSTSSVDNAGSAANVEAGMMATFTKKVLG
jgi:hypothetical protein